ncbi:MAG: DUF805 domain-containing protein [Pirellulaceae bacterium]|nr:DUF805 domain-containing protein [Pirellulaceae bacterium]
MLFVISLLVSFFAIAVNALPVVLMPAVIIRFAMLWPWFAINAKRWHDRDKSGVWSLIVFIPVIGGIWMLVECGFLSGKSGSNDYGAAP